MRPNNTSATPDVAAVAELFRSYRAERRPDMHAHIYAALRYPRVSRAEFVELAVAAGHNRNNAQNGYSKASGAVVAMRAAHLDAKQTAEAAGIIWPAVLAQAQDLKAEQGRAEERAGALALAIMALRFAAVPAQVLAFGLAEAFGVANAPGHLTFTRAVARRGIELGAAPWIDPVLAAALSVKVPGGSPDQSVVLDARARQLAAIAAARAKLRAHSL